MGVLVLGGQLVRLREVQQRGARATTAALTMLAEPLQGVRGVQGDMVGSGQEYVHHSSKMSRKGSEQKLGVKWRAAGRNTLTGCSTWRGVQGSTISL